MNGKAEVSRTRRVNQQKILDLLTSMNAMRHDVRSQMSIRIELIVMRHRVYSFWHIMGPPGAWVVPYDSGVAVSRER